MTDLNFSDSGTADATGRAVATLQPLRAFETWRVKRMTVQSSSSPSVPECRVYRGHESPSMLIDGTFTGTLDTSEVDQLVQNGEALIAVWTGCEPGASCVFSIQGERTVG